jgi:hypothetical protein
MRTIGSLTIGCALLALGAGTARGQVQKQEIIKEIQAAFELWSKIPCTNLKFEYKGELPAYQTEKQGALVVYFGYSKATWPASERAYQWSDHVDDETTGEITNASIGLNAYGYTWSIGKQFNAMDIRTTMIRLIPMAIGFYVGPDSKGIDPTGLIKYDFVDHTLHPLHILGAQYIYPQAGPGCPTLTGLPPICGSTTWMIDAGPTPEAGPSDLGVPMELGSPLDKGAVKDLGAPVADQGAAPSDSKADATADLPLRLCIHHTKPNDPSKGKPYHWKVPVPWYLFLSSEWGRVPGGKTFPEMEAGVQEGGLSPDLGGTGSGGDDGCCRVSHAGAGAAPGALLLLALLCGLVVRARRRR